MSTTRTVTIILCLGLAVGACAKKPYPPVHRSAAPEAPTASFEPGAVSAPAVPAAVQATGEAETVQASYTARTAAAPVPVGPPPMSLVNPGDLIEIRYYRNTRLETERYDITVGDVLRVDVLDHPDVSRERILVLPDGHISLPLVGSLRAAGKNVDELSFELAKRYQTERILDPQVAVAVEESDQRLQALLDRAAGGGSQPSVRITVSETGFLNLPYIAPVAVKGRSMADLQELIREAYHKDFGGRLEVTTNLVERAVPLVYVMGEVVNPIGVEVTRNMNPYMAVAAAGGFLPTAAPDEVRVARFHADGTYDQWAFDMESALEGKRQSAAGFKLQPQDVVFVPPSGIAEANRWVDQYIRELLPFTINMGFGISYDINGDN